MADYNYIYSFNATGETKELARYVNGALDEGTTEVTFEYSDPQQRWLSAGIVENGNGTGSIMATASENPSDEQGRSVELEISYELNGEDCTINILLCQPNKRGETPAEGKLNVFRIGGDWVKIDCNDNSGVTKSTFTDAGITITDIASVKIGDCVKTFSGLSGATSLSSITISDSVEEFGDYAFAGCSGLTSITIPDSVTEIGTYCFIDCIGLKTAHISTRIASISEGLFSGCKNLETVNIPTGITSIGSESFMNCDSLNGNFDIYNTVETVGNSAFNHCINLESITYKTPNIKVTTIEDETFKGCIHLTGFTIPTTITSIGSGAFTNCISLTALSIPTSVKTIGSAAFSECSGFTSMTIPTGVTRIEEGTFRQCRSLTSVTLQGNVTYIGKEAFKHCSPLTGITIPNTVTSIGEEAFRGDSNMNSITIPNSVETLDKNCFAFCRFSSVDIGTGITTINDGAFSDYGTLSNLNLICRAATPPTLGSGVFANTVVTSIKVPSESVGNYQSAPGWSGYSAKISAI